MIKTLKYYELLSKYLPEELSPEQVIESVNENDKEVLEFYWIFRPFVSAKIIKDENTGAILYNLLEPTLIPEEYELLERIYSDLGNVLIFKHLTFDILQKEKILVDAFNELLDDYLIDLDPILKVKYIYYLFRDFLGVGPIDGLLNDPYIEDISCNGYNIPVHVYHKRYGSIPTNVSFKEEELDRYVQALVQISGKHISYGNPVLDASLPDGSRIQANYGTEVTPRGSSFTIRKFTEEPLTPIDLIRLGTYSPEQMAYFWLGVENKLNMLIVGETAAGKTTTLNAILMFIPPDVKVISIEDTREIALKHDNWLAAVTREVTTGDEEPITMYDLLKAALRQRPEYIVVGEIRGIEAQTLFQAMSTGHAAYSTLHAGDVRQVIYRLETQPLNVPRSLIQFLDVVSIQTQVTIGGIKMRRSKNIYEFIGVDPDTKNLLINELYRWVPYEDNYMLVNPSKKVEKIAMMRNESVEETVEEIKKRSEYLRLLDKSGVRDYRKVTQAIHAYYRNPDESLEALLSEGIQVWG